MESFQYCGGIPSVLWGDNSSTCGGYLQYCGGCSVQWDNISTVGDSISTVEGIQYSGGYLQYSRGIPSVQWRDNISTVEVAQYSGDKDFKYYEFSKYLEIFTRAYFASKSH